MQTAITRACNEMNIKYSFYDTERYVAFKPNEEKRRVKIRLPMFNDILFFQPNTPKAEILKIFRKCIKINSHRQRQKLKKSQRNLF